MNNPIDPIEKMLENVRLMQEEIKKMKKAFDKRK